MSKMEEMANAYQDKLIKESTSFPSEREWKSLIGRDGHTQGWKDCLKSSEEVKELVDRLKATEYANAANFDKYVEGIEKMKRKLQKLKQLILLTDPLVSGEQMNEIALKQWNEFIREFPDEQ